MKKYILILLCLFLLAPAGLAKDSYDSLKIVNGTNWVKYFDDLLGYRYDSHGCLHFTPADIYLLYKTIPAGIPLTVKSYKLKENEPPFDAAKVPYFVDKIKTDKDIKTQAAMFKNYKTELIFYPSLNMLFIMVNDGAYAKVSALSGVPYNFLMAYDVQKGKDISWDFMLSTPTDPGNYQVLRLTDHYLSSAYYKNTIVPFGAWIKKVKGIWSYQKGSKWYRLPDHVKADLMRPAVQREYNYYDVNVNHSGKVTAARYAGHDFGKYVMLWTVDGKNHYAEMGYAAGELVYEQVVLVKDLVHLLTLPATDDFDSCVAQNNSFSFYKELYDFIESKGSKIPSKGSRSFYANYKLFNGFDLDAEDNKYLDPRLIKAFKEHKENRLPRNKQARWKALGLYHYLMVNSQIIDKQAHWYGKVKQDWDLFKNLRIKLREDFDRMGILSLANRQNIVEEWLSNRLEFKQAALPKQAKYLTDLSFSTFFKPDDQSKLFTERERAIMLEQIKKAAKAEGKGLSLNIVDALNNYNFGVLLNEILGDLYKSHGCMHVSPRNAVFLYELLPVGAEMKVHKYSERISPEVVAEAPFLADMVNFAEDLEKLKENFLVTEEVKVAVYSFSGNWIIYVKDKPFARMRIRGGPQTKMYLVQGRDKNNKPIFEDHLAYPTSPGDYYIFEKVENYLSNIYRDQTTIPMGGVISKEGDIWICQNTKGEWVALPGALKTDLSRPEEEREYTYYDVVRDESSAVVQMKWGSQPFGTYALRTTVNKKTAWPELIHSSGDLIMEERQLVNDLIKILTAPYDELDDCVKNSQNFGLYKICYDFIRNPERTDLIQARERSAYRLYYGLPLTTQEAALLPQDVIIANKVLKKKKLTDDEIKVLIDEGIAYRRSGNLKVNMEKILGLQFDTYQYVVTIQKYAHHYATLKSHWDELSGMRQALLKDFNTFVLKDTQLFHNFMRELMLKRTQLERLSQDEALKLLNSML